MRQQQRQTIPTATTPPSPSSDQSALQQAPSNENVSLAYSMDTDVFPSPPPAYQFQRSERIDTNNNTRPGSFATTEDSIDHSLCSEMSYDYASFQGYSYQNADQQQGNGVANENTYNRDATDTVHRMHRSLLQLLSNPDLFHEALEWEELVERGVVDPAAYLKGDRKSKLQSNANGIQSFESEFFDEDTDCPTSPGDGASEHKQTEKGDDGSNALKHSADEDFSNALASTTQKADEKEEKKYYTPLAHQIFAPDAEVVLPEALTASQLFGIERVTGIELEAAAGIAALSHLFLRWLALMPEGDHMNVIDPPGLTVMRIAGGRYRVTGAHRVVWRWMNSFSPASALLKPSDTPIVDENKSMDNPKSCDTDFDFGDLVTMTIIDVFETDSDGKLLSYCPTFDNRAVHKTQEVTERIRKGASSLMEKMVVAKESPAGKSVNKAAGNFGKMAITMGSMVRHKIEEEIHKHQMSPKAEEDENNNENPTEPSKDQKSAPQANKVTTPSAFPTRRMEV